LNPIRGVPVQFKTSLKMEEFEDARGIFYRDQTWIFVSNFLRGERGKHWVKQVLAKVDKEWNILEQTVPFFGRNGRRPWEKNWLWFFHEERLYMLYSADSHHIVVEFGESLCVVKENITRGVTWQWGAIHGGTPPVLYEGEYWTFFHSWLREPEPYGRRYFMGAYTFESKPPFRITRITGKPLLRSNLADFWKKRNPLVVFPTGALLRDGQWLVTLGVNDLLCAWVKIPVKAIF
jgi:hypothetical protein